MIDLKKRRAFLVVPPNVQLLDISGPAHIFSEARAAGANVELVYLSMGERSSEMSEAGVSLGNLKHFSKYQPSSLDWIIVPGVIGQNLIEHKLRGKFDSFNQWLRQQYQNGAKVCSICTGLYLVGYSGLLKDRSCTTHWKYFDHFHDTFPGVQLMNNRLFVQDENIYSSAGVSSGIDLALFLLEEAYGPLFAVQIAKEVVIYLRRTENDPQLSIFLQYRNHLEDRVHIVQNELVQRLSENPSIEDLADSVHMSARNLSRLFKQNTGITIGFYAEKLRIERAIQLLSEGAKQEAVAQAIGVSRNQLGNILRKYRASMPENMS